MIINSAHLPVADKPLVRRRAILAAAVRFRMADYLPAACMDVAILNKSYK
jgi:hypothetical protein